MNWSPFNAPRTALAVLLSAALCACAPLATTPVPEEATPPAEPRPTTAATETGDDLKQSIRTVVDDVLEAETPLDEALVGRLLSLALACVHREYPNVILHRLESAADAQAPSTLYPAFYGCFDWHSAVHGHWLLARLARLYPDHPQAPEAREALFLSLGNDRIAGEVAYLTATGRQSFERPYGLAWLLQLDQELAEWAIDDPLADRMSNNLAGLADVAATHLRRWLPKLSHPVRSGTHGQTAFALSLWWDWAAHADHREDLALLRREAERLYGADVDCPLHYEPSGHDFLSACLAEADLLRRLLAPDDFSRGLEKLLPEVASAPQAWLPVAVVTDPTDGHLVHLDGLNLSRAWMLDGILSALPSEDPRRSVLEARRRAHREAGLRSIVAPHYAGGHWLGSFATYLMTQRGLSSNS